MKPVTNNVANFGNFFNSIPLHPLSAQEKISSKNAVREEWEIPVCLGDNDKNLGGGGGGGGGVLGGGMCKNF